MKGGSSKVFVYQNIPPFTSAIENLPNLFSLESLIEVGKLSNAQTTMPLREADLLPSNKRVPFLPFISGPKEVSLDFLHSVSYFPWDSKET